MAVAVVILFILAGIVYLLSRKNKTVRKLSDDRARHEASRVPVTGKCACGKPRCPYKNKQHPPQTGPGQYVHKVETVQHLRNSNTRRKHGG